MNPNFFKKGGQIFQGNQAHILLVEDKILEL